MSKITENYGLTKPEVGEFFSLETWNENMDKIDGELKKREDAQKESDNSLMNPKFTEAKERKNLTSGEKIHLMLGKISRFFSDMKAIAFSGSYNDLVDKPKIPKVLNNQTTTKEGFALDARQANPNIDGSLAKQLSDLNGSLESTFKLLDLIKDANDAHYGISQISTKLDGTANNPFPNFWTVLFTVPLAINGKYVVQIAISVAAEYNGKLAVRAKDNGTWGNWNIIS